MGCIVSLMVVMLVLCASAFGEEGIDCGTLTVRVLTTVYDTVHVTVYDTVRVVVIDTVKAPANLWNAEHLIVSRSTDYPQDSTRWHGEIWLYDAQSRCGSGWTADLTMIGETMDNRIFRVESVSLPPMNVWTGSIGSIQFFELLNSRKKVRAIQ